MVPDNANQHDHTRPMNLELHKCARMASSWDKTPWLAPYCYQTHRHHSLRRMLPKTGPAEYLMWVIYRTLKYKVRPGMQLHLMPGGILASTLLLASILSYCFHLTSWPPRAAIRIHTGKHRHHSWVCSSRKHAGPTKTTIADSQTRTVLGQKYSSDALFTPKVPIFTTLSRCAMSMRISEKFVLELANM